MSERVRRAAGASAAAFLEAELAWRVAQNMMRAWATEKTSGSKEDEEAALRVYVEAKASSMAANERYKSARTELAEARAEFVQQQLGRRGGWP